MPDTFVFLGLQICGIGLRFRHIVFRPTGIGLGIFYIRPGLSGKAHRKSYEAHRIFYVLYRKSYMACRETYIRGGAPEVAGRRCGAADSSDGVRSARFSEGSVSASGLYQTFRPGGQVVLGLDLVARSLHAGFATCISGYKKSGGQHQQSAGYGCADAPPAGGRGFCLRVCRTHVVRSSG